ncbi:microfibrillar-associated protein 5 [Arvicola amphibius]|uniref:microfibrillar-associated protein 5 n=1 Tax=Arvicola amphibius TaxID=1047088 RepID=UPI001C0991F3|nr:microfibrillar-associated protein 5 [Arvicola amphibius]
MGPVKEHCKRDKVKPTKTNGHRQTFTSRLKDPQRRRQGLEGGKGRGRRATFPRGETPPSLTIPHVLALLSSDMPFFGSKSLLLVMALIIPSDDVAETFTEDPNLVNDPSTDATVLADITPSTDDLASAGDKNATAECRDEKFACTRLYSVHRPVKQCVHQVCFTSLRRMYIINNEICSRLVCKEHEAMKDELCRQMAGLPPRRLRRSNYFRLPPCENMNLQRPSGL